MHSGQVGQPRPDPVSRTAPPVTTIAICKKTRKPKTLPAIEPLPTNMIKAYWVACYPRLIEMDSKSNFTQTLSERIGASRGITQHLCCEKE